VSLPGLGTGITVDVHQAAGKLAEDQILFSILSRVDRTSAGRCFHLVASGYHLVQQLYRVIY